MSSFHNYMEKAVFYSKERPEMLVGVIETVIGEPEEIKTDVILKTISSKNGTALSTLKKELPTTVAIPNSHGVPFDVTVEWGGDTAPTFNPTKEGDYVLDGTIGGLPKYLTNGGSKKVKVTIHVEKAAV